MTLSDRLACKASEHGHIVVAALGIAAFMATAQLFVRALPPLVNAIAQGRVYHG